KAVNKNVKSNSLYQTTVLVIAGIISILLIMFYLKPLASNIYNNFASIEIRVNKESLDPALDYLNKALFYDEYNEISLYTKMRILDFKRDFQNAEKIALKLMSISPYFKDVNQLYGDILLKQNKTIEADYFINKGLRVSKPFDSYYLLKSQNLIREQKYEQAEEILKKNYSRIENKSYINYMLGKISELGNMKTKAYENYRNSIRAGADNAINYYNFGIFLLKEKKIDEGIFYLYLARIIDSNKRTISPAFWSQVFRILNPNLILSNQVGLRTKIMFVDLKLLLNYPQNIETDITNLKPQLLSNALFSKYVLYFELKSAFLKNGNFSREQIDEIFNNIEPHPELISVTPKIFLNFSDAQIYANKLLEKASKYGDENVFNIGLLVTLLKTFENYSVQGISEKLSGIINLRSPKTFKNEKQLNSFGPAGFDFDPTNINAGDEKKLSLYFGIDNVLPLKIKGRFEISSDTFQLGFNSGKSEIDLDLEKFYSGDVIKKNVVLDFKDYIPSGFYNLKFVYRIDCEDTIYSENLNMIKNEFVYHIAKIEVTGDKNKELENRALYCIKNAMYDEADDILFNKLPDDYKDTDVFYQFNKYKIKVIKNNFETALKQKEKIEKLGEKFLAEIPKSVSKINSFYYYNEKTNFINNRFIKKSKNPKDYIFTYLFEMYDSDLFDIIYKEPESKPKIIHYEEKPPFPYFIHKKSSTLDEQLFFIKSCLECIKKDFYDPNNFYSPSIIEFSTAFIKSLSLSQHKNKIIDMCLDFNNFLCKIAESDNIKSGELFNGKNLKTVYNFIDILSDLDRNKEADLLLNKIRKHIKSYQQSNDIFYFYKNLNQILKNHSGDGQILTNFTFSKIKEFPYNYLTEIKNVFNNHIENDYIKKNVIKILDKKFLFDDSKFLIKDRTDYFDVLENEVILYYPDLIKLRFKIKLTNLFYPNSYYDISVGYLDPFYDFIGIDNIRISGDLLKNEVILYEKNLRIEKQFFENIKTGKMQIKLKYFNIKDKIYPFLIPEMKY
nr:hypothetical protein [bacterium]